MLNIRDLSNRKPRHEDVSGSVRIAPSFLTSALDWGEWWASCPGSFTPRELAPGTHSIGVCVGPRASLDVVEKRKSLTLPGIQPQRNLTSGTSLAKHSSKKTKSLAITMDLATWQYSVQPKFFSTGNVLQRKKYSFCARFFSFVWVYHVAVSKLSRKGLLRRIAWSQSERRQDSCERASSNVFRHGRTDGRSQGDCTHWQ
jgi:hypothetical protein